MIRTYKLKQEANKNKEEKIINILREYRRTSKQISSIQWNNFYQNNKQFNKDMKYSIISKLSARYIQTCSYQVVSMLNSYISNIQNRFSNIVYNSSLDESTKIQLFYINKYKKYFNKEVKMQGEYINQDILKLSRNIFSHLTKHSPTFKNINLALDNKVANIENNKGTSSFDYWIQLSTLEKYSPIYIPVKSNKYFNSKLGTLKNFVQFNFNKKRINISLIKDIEKNNVYIPKTPKIGIDIGLKILFATNSGDLFSRGFYSRLTYYDNIITKLSKELSKQKIKLSINEQYNNLISIRRNYVKNEISKAINRIIKLYAPKEIVLENLHINNPNLSRRINRLLNTFGKQQIENKLKSISEELGIIITKINPAYTSKTCSNCGYVDEKNRKSQSNFLCKICFKKQNADVNAAKNILVRSSYKELVNIYISRKSILQGLTKLFLERSSCSYSRAKAVINKNKYFSNYGSNNLIENAFL